LVDALGRDVLAADKVHADHTPVPVLEPSRGQTKNLSGTALLTAMDPYPWRQRPLSEWRINRVDGGHPAPTKSTNTKTPAIRGDSSMLLNSPRTAIAQIDANVAGQPRRLFLRSL